MTESIPGHDEVRRSGHRSRVALGPLLPGVVLTVVGLAFLLDNLDLVDSWTILRFWPLILLVVGLRKLVGAPDRGSAVSGTLLAAAGALLLLNSLNLIDVDPGELWPLVLVAIGIRTLINAMSDSKDLSESEEAAAAFLGGVEHRNRSADYRGGYASAFMGGVKLDLREADIAGERAVIHVFAMMGGLEIRVPEEWTVEVGVMPMMGGVEDKTRGPAVAGKRLVLKGTVIMGGIEIRN